MRAAHVDKFLLRAERMNAPYYHEFMPPDDLRGFVACTWARLVRNEGRGTTHAILPDGCADIMVFDDQPPCIAGPDSVTRWSSLHDGLVITGIRLRPGACRAILGVPAERLVNGTMQLSDIAPGAVVLHQRLLLTDNSIDRRALLENWVRDALENASDKDRAVIAACRMIAANANIDIGGVAVRLDWNTRKLHRQFIAACGYGPKHFQRIMRVQAVLRAAHTAPATLAELAAAGGYCDQAHMTRDFRDITTFTPAAYFAGAVASEWGAWLSEDW